MYPISGARTGGVRFVTAHVDHATLMFEGGTRLSFEGLTEDRRCADPQVTFTLVADEVQKPRTKVRSSVIDVPFLDDPAIGSFASTVVTALQRGAPQFYAQVFAQWIAAHVIHRPSAHAGERCHDDAIGQIQIAHAEWGKERLDGHDGAHGQGIKRLTGRQMRPCWQALY